MPFDPDVRPWSGVSAVSPSTYLILSTPMPSSSPAIWRMAMRSPWPRSTLPQYSVTVPSPLTERNVSTALGSTDRAPPMPPARVGLCQPARAKPTVSTPPAKTLRRVKPARRVGRCGVRCIRMSASLPGGGHHRAYDSDMRSTAAEIALERAADIVLGRLWFVRKQRNGADNHAARAIAALRYLRLDERRLHRVRRRNRAKPFEGGDRLALRIRNGRQAGAHRAAADQHIAGAALTEAATEFCCGEAEAAQPVEQRLDAATCGNTRWSALCPALWAAVRKQCARWGQPLSAAGVIRGADLMTAFRSKADILRKRCDVRL